jgi:hypothetical protein
MRTVPSCSDGIGLGRERGRLYALRTSAGLLVGGGRGAVSPGAPWPLETRN